MGPNTKRLLEEWGEDLVADVLAALESHGSIATGRLYLSLRFEVKEALDELRVLIMEEDYGKYVDRGRHQGKMPPLENIKAWCRVKGIPERAAFPIARKIGRVGIQPTNYFSVPLAIRTALLKDEINEAFKLDVLMKIKEIASKINQHD